MTVRDSKFEVFGTSNFSQCLSHMLWQATQGGMGEATGAWIESPVVRPAGIEPATYSLEGCCSIQLSYGRPLRSSGLRVLSCACGSGIMEESTESIALYFSYNSALKTQSSALGGGLVGARGFEPPTSCSQSRRATGLRYAPTDRLRNGQSSLVTSQKESYVMLACAVLPIDQ